MRILPALLLPFLLWLAVPARADDNPSAADSRQEYIQIYSFTPVAGREFTDIQKLMVRDSRYYAPADWAIRQFNLQWNITPENVLLISRKPVVVPRGDNGTGTGRNPWTDHPPGVEIEGRDFPNIIPGESNNPLQSYVDLEAFAAAAGGSYVFNQDTGIIHLKTALPEEGTAPSRPPLCQDTIDAIAKADAATADSHPWWADFKPACNGHDELVNENSGRAIVFFGHPCPGGVVHVTTDAERKAWQAENEDLSRRYDVVNETSCPCCIP